MAIHHALSGELIDELNDVLKDASLDGKTRYNEW